MFFDMTPMMVAATVATFVSTPSYSTTEDIQMADAVPVHSTKKGHKAPAKAEPKFGEPKPKTNPEPKPVPPVKTGTETVLPDGAIRRDN